VPQSGPVRFRSYPAGLPLRAFVRNCWTMHCDRALAAPLQHRVLPDGCIDVIFTRRSPTREYTVAVAGTMTRPMFAELTGHVDYLGVRFAPGGFRHFFDVPPEELTDRVVPFDSLCAGSGLVGQAACEEDVRARLSRIESELVRRLRPERPDPILTKVLQTISACGGNITVSQLARLTDRSPRHLGRTFRAAVGVGPKTFCRIVRFRNALRALRRGPRAGLLAVALEAGYYDQAHFIHEFNDLYGSSPAAALQDPAL
jgi:AraC-like DNA-binding protein